MYHLCGILEWCAGILASLIVVFCTQIINNHFFVPKRKMKEQICKVDATLNYYANIITNPGGTDKEHELEASKELRRTAMEFMSFIAFNPKIKYGEITHNELDSIGPELIRLSNSVGRKDYAEKNHIALSELRTLLYKNNPNTI